MDFSIYAIKAVNYNRIYVGFSLDVVKRVSEHNRGMVTSTKGYRPWKLIFTEVVGPDRKEARKREKYYKSGCGKEFLKNYYENLPL